MLILYSSTQPSPPRVPANVKLPHLHKRDRLGQYVTGSANTSYGPSPVHMRLGESHSSFGHSVSPRDLPSAGALLPGGPGEHAYHCKGTGCFLSGGGEILTCLGGIDMFSRETQRKCQSREDMIQDVILEECRVPPHVALEDYPPM